MRLTKSMKKNLVGAIASKSKEIDFISKACDLIRADFELHIPYEIKALAKNKDLQHHLCSSSFYIPYFGRYVRLKGSISDYKLSEELKFEIESLYSLNKDQDNLLESLENTLTQLLTSVNTDKQLEEKLPDIYKFYKQQEPQIANLPAVVNLNELFKKHGIKV